jgi:hypothetical protein
MKRAFQSSVKMIDGADPSFGLRHAEVGSNSTLTISAGRPFGRAANLPTCRPTEADWARASGEAGAL